MQGEGSLELLGMILQIENLAIITVIIATLL